MAKLYEIDSAIADCIDGETGEIIDIERLEELQIERDQKIENVSLWYKNLISDAEQYKAEKNAFADKEYAARKKADSLKRYLESALNGEQYKSTRVAISYRKSDSIVIDDVQSIPADYLKFSDPAVDRIKLKNAIKEGTEIAGAHIESKQNIQIK